MKHKIKLPSGQTFHELFHYMGGDDEQTLHQRPKPGQRLVELCSGNSGKVIMVDDKELAQLIHEVDNMISIKQDHVGNGSWTALQQWQVENYYKKLKMIQPS